MKALYRLLYYLSILLTSILAGFTLAGAFAGDASNCQRRVKYKQPTEVTA